MAFLGQTGLVADEIGHYLQPARDLIHQIQREMDQFGKHTVKADANDQRAFPRLNMDIAGPSADGRRVRDRIRATTELGVCAKEGVTAPVTSVRESRLFPDKGVVIGLWLGCSRFPTDDCISCTGTYGKPPNG